MERVIVTNPFVSLIFMQVCAVADATDEEILAICNQKNPSGTSAGWAQVVRRVPAESDGLVGPQHEPVVCGSYPDRRHFLVSC